MCLMGVWRPVDNLQELVLSYHQGLNSGPHAWQQMPLLIETPLHLSVFWLNNFNQGCLYDIG